MRAELLKLRSMPTPRWTIVGALAALAVTIVISIIYGVGTDDAALGLGAELPSAVAVIVIASWVVGVEYGQHTMRRSLTAEPRRMRLLIQKLVTAVVVAVVVTVGIYLVAAATLPAIASAHDQDLTLEHVARSGLAALISNSAFAIIAASFSFLARSMAGGVTIALVYGFMLDPTLSLIPKVGDFTGSAASMEIYDALVNNPGDHNLMRAAALLLGWVALFAVAGALRFTRSDA